MVVVPAMNSRCWEVVPASECNAALCVCTSSILERSCVHDLSLRGQALYQWLAILLDEFKVVIILIA